MIHKMGWFTFPSFPNSKPLPVKGERPRLKAAKLSTSKPTNLWITQLWKENEFLFGHTFSYKTEYIENKMCWYHLFLSLLSRSQFIHHCCPRIWPRTGPCLLHRPISTQVPNWEVLASLWVPPPQRRFARDPGIVWCNPCTLTANSESNRHSVSNLEKIYFSRSYLNRYRLSWR